MEEGIYLEIIAAQRYWCGKHGVLVFDGPGLGDIPTNEEQVTVAQERKGKA